MKTQLKNRFYDKSEWKEKIRASKIGDKNPQWKGDNVGYFALHIWVRLRKEKPDVCDCCEIKPPHDLANKSGEYKRDLDDWMWLCRRCHMQLDGRLNKLVEKNRAGRKNIMSVEEQRHRWREYKRASKKRRQVAL
jgi:hypothetical protein